MASKRDWVCIRCGHSESAPALFDSLLSIAQGNSRRCDRCAGDAELRIDFPFGLDAPDSQCTVCDSFLPEKLESWPDASGKTVTFFPFLVIAERHGRDLAAWLPYWHVVTDGDREVKKYGQWAPFMDFHLFDSLISQARAKGYFSLQSRCVNGEAG